ncbi:MAG: P-loop NTPase fold protein [Clostridium sp.]|uniref:KAP family P-loop NTPase fold protein n=1 Tax=Clostridium sp. TaxID=1506 RepID=UPI002FCA9C98
MSENLCSFENDLLDRKNLAVNLTKIVERSNESKVIAIDSSWGSGKTTFVKMWLNMLNSEEQYKDKYRTIYFNAWENDYIKDPLLALIAEIEKTNNQQQGKAAKLCSSIVENGKKVVRPIVNIPLKLCTAGSVGVEDFKLTSSEKDILESVKEQKELRETFTTEIQKYSKEDNCSLIFFIDELDRCRPIFAIELLETIKHLFNAEGITFIVSIDKEQLGYSISTLYGNGMDSDGYLRRFFDIEYKIPMKNKRDYIKIKNKELFKGYINTDFFQVFLREYLLKEAYSLRDIDKTYKYLEVLIPIIDIFNDLSKKYKDTYIISYSYILANMINLKIKHASLYRDIINFNYEPSKAYLQKILAADEYNNMDFEAKRWTHDRIVRLISQSLLNYLILINLRSIGEDKLHEILEDENNEFIITSQDVTEYYIDDNDYNMVGGVLNDEMNIIELMEFIDDIEWGKEI